MIVFKDQIGPESLRTSSTFRLSPYDLASFVVVIGALATFRPPYIYGLVNHIENLPSIFHLASPDLYAYDWHVQQSIVPGPRYYFYHTLAFLSHLAPLSLIMFVGTLVSNTMSILATVLMGRELFRNDLAAMFGAALVASIHSIDLGWATFIIYNYLVQATPAQPLALFSLWAAVRRKPILATVFGCASAIIHPVVGLETGGIALGLVALRSLWDWIRGLDRRENVICIGLSGIGVFCLVVIAYGLFLGRTETSITDRQFFDILVYFRNPHHYVPSFMAGDLWFWFVVFCVGTGMSWVLWKLDSSTPSGYATSLLILGIILFVVLLVGYVFVEIVPVRAVASAQLYRNIFIVKWFGLMLFGHSAALWFQKGGYHRVSALTALAGAGPIQPLTVLCAHIVERIVVIGARYRKVLIPAIIISAIAAGNNYIQLDHSREPVFLFLTLSITAWFFYFRHTIIRALAPIAICLIVFPILVLSPSLRTQLNMGVYTLEQGSDPFDGVAAYAREFLPKNANVVVPPSGGRFRMMARRAILIDFKSFVFQDSSIVQWRTRMDDVYGHTNHLGFDAASDLEQNYRRITDQKLLALKTKYGATHAVLFRETPTHFSTVFEDGLYKIVQMPGAHAVRNP